MPEAPSSLLVPQTVDGRYEIRGAPVGQGGMGVVYKAYDIVTKRYVALKTMWGDVDPVALELFEREWSVLAHVSHPNIVDILDSGKLRENGQQKPYFVMPFLPGITLDQLIKSSSQRLTVLRAVEIVCQVCRGLQAAHDHQLIHRDLKPSNIFVMEDDSVKIIDFGVVHLADARSLTGLKGALQYMAPEQFEMKPASPQSDIFSLGVVCYEALTGRKPFSRKTEIEVVEAIRTYMPPPASDINPAVTQLLSRTVHKAMAKLSWHRFSTAREFAETLQKAIRNEPIDRFDRSKIQPRMDRIKKAHGEGDLQFAMEILAELESEGHIDPEMSLLRIQIEQSVHQKTIRQLLESARTRMEEDEFPLALQKLRDVLNIDPNNVDALSLRDQIERQRSKKQIDNWLRLVRQHIDNQLFSQARQGIDEILKIDSSDSRARQLRAELDSTEKEAVKIREEQQKLYDSAVASYKNGEISTALSKLERVLELNRHGPKSVSPERDAQYQSFYNQIRSERDAARNTYAEGRKHVVDHNFAKALEICDDFLERHPGDPMFQALKIEAEEMQRQEQSAAVAEVNRRAEAEPDLDKKYNIINEALEKYPNEPHFRSSLKLVRDRRDLVNSIVGRARQYEERGLFNDAAGQWDILKNIYPPYPGLDFEVQRLSRRREEQLREEAKTRWVEKVDRHFADGEYATATEIVKEALLEFPEDKELQGLEALTEEAKKRSSEAQKLVEQGQILCSEKRYEEGLSALRSASRLDERSPVCRAALLSNLLEHARILTMSNWHAAGPLVQEAMALDPTDPTVRNLASLLEDYRRQEAVGEYVIEARNLQAAGDIQGALKKVEDGLAAHPNELRLAQLHHTFRNALAWNAAAIPEQISLAATETAVPASPPVYETFAGSPVESAKISRTTAALLMGSALTAVVIAVIVLFLIRTKPVPKPQEPVTASPIHRTQPTNPRVPETVAPNLEPPDIPPVKLDNQASDQVSVTVAANVPDATVVVNGKPNRRPMSSGTRLLLLKPGIYKIKVIHDGYEDSAEQQVDLKAGLTKLPPLTFSLSPVARSGMLAIDSAPLNTEVLVDGAVAGNVSATGTFTHELNPGTHSIVLRRPNFEDLTASHEFRAGESFRVNAEGMKEFGKIAFRLSPTNAKISYRSEGDSTWTEMMNGEVVVSRSGNYVINAQAEGFKARTESVSINSGKTAIIDWSLEAATVPKQSPITPATVFEFGSFWTVEKDGWWVHEAKGDSFLRATEGTFVIDFLKDGRKSLFRKAKRICFIADYRGENDRVVYTLDAHNLIRKVYAGGHAGDEVKVPHSMDSLSTYRLTVEITSDRVVIKNGAGKVLDSLRREGAMGKFGFEDEVALTITRIR